MKTPHDTEPGPAGPTGPGGTEPGEHGPRVSREEIRDLARLRRSRTDRKVAGVAAGVAYHLDIDPLLVRIAFVVLTFFGGGGLILYAAAWLVVPEAETGEQVVKVDDGLRTAVLIIAGIVAIGSMIGDAFGGAGSGFGIGPFLPWPVLIVALVFVVMFASKQAKQSGANSGFWAGCSPSTASDQDPAAGQAGGPTYPGYRPGPPPFPKLVDLKRRGPLLFPFTLALAALAVGVVGTMHLAGVDVALSAYPATVLGVVGLMLLVGTFYGRAGGLIFVGLVAAAATAITSVVGTIDAGQIAPKIDTVAELNDSYDLGAGEIIIDLTDIDPAELKGLDGKTLDLEVGIGHIEVIVPAEGLRVEADATIDAGEVVLFGNKSESDEKAANGSPDLPTLKIDADVFLGQIEITLKEAA